jgi:tyrosyl-tRNA synthetase
MKNSQIDELFKKGVEEVIVGDSLKKKLLSGKKLRIKHGVDPTTSNLSLGHAVCYHKLKEFQELGHKIVFLIGDFTARFGDPDKETARQMRKAEEVKQMAKNYIEQVGKVLDLRKTEIVYNSTWYEKMSAEELLKLISKFTIARLLERDMFVQRLKKNKEIQAHEIVYPVLQGYDSVMIESDLTVIGTDQKFNELQGRKLQEEVGQKPQDILTVPILVGTDGKQKMSQSLGNDISLNDDYKQMFGKVMSIPDDAIINYAELAGRMSLLELEKIKKLVKNDPREAKIIVGRAIVDIYYPGKGTMAEAEFNRIFKDKQIPFDIPWVKLSGKNQIGLVDILLKVKLVNSKSEAKRLIEQGGIKIDKVQIRNINSTIQIHDGMIIQSGKRKYVKIILKK